MRLAAFQNASVKLHKKRGIGISGRLGTGTYAPLFFYRSSRFIQKLSTDREICVILLE